MLEVDAVAVGVDGTALDSGEGVIARWVGVVDPVELEFTEGVVVGVASGDDVEASAEAATKPKPAEMTPIEPMTELSSA